VRLFWLFGIERWWGLTASGRGGAAGLPLSGRDSFRVLVQFSALGCIDLGDRRVGVEISPDGETSTQFEQAFNRFWDIEVRPTISVRR
jgi:hypothetical protein